MSRTRQNAASASRYSPRSRCRQASITAALPLNSGSPRSTARSQKWNARWMSPCCCATVPRPSRAAARYRLLPASRANCQAWRARSQSFSCWYATAMKQAARGAYSWSLVDIAFRQASLAARLSRCFARTRPSSKAAQAGTLSPFTSLASRTCWSQSAASLSCPSCCGMFPFTRRRGSRTESDAQRSPSPPWAEPPPAVPDRESSMHASGCHPRRLPRNWALVLRLFQQLVSLRPEGRLGTIPDPDALEGGAEVGLHGLLTDTQPAGDLLVREATDDQAQDVTLAIGECRRRVASAAAIGPVGDESLRCSWRERRLPPGGGADAAHQLVRVGVLE